MSIDALDYEAWQPPLYYALAAPLFAATAGRPTTTQVIALRLISIVTGAVLIYLTYRLVGVIFDDDKPLALITAALVAFIPMHLTMAAAVNNDVPAEAIIAGILLVSLLRLNGCISRRAFVLGGGLLYGLGLLTKGTVYPLAAILLAAEFGHRRLEVRDELKSPLLSLFFLFSIALALSAWWFTRNATIYGDLDIFARQRHDAVVAGQVRTADWIADHGWAAYWDRAWNFTFKSFWGVFGWMGVFMDQRIYIGLLILTVIGVAGFALFLIRAIRRPGCLSRRQWASLSLLALSVVLTFGTYVWYNLTFMQHQGRYLFPALTSIALFAALGTRELTPSVIWRAVPALLTAGLVALNLITLKWFIIPNL
jgi:hypothetical protein